MNHRSMLLRRAVAGTVALISAPALAQTASQSAELRTVETIVVTAQKREQNLQDVPIVVTAISEQLLRDTGVKDIKDLTVLTPGLLVTSTTNESVTTARIRGVGTVGDNPGLESSVGIVIDGVYRPRNGVGFGDLGELERIEVLKGPQGTLFGKNTSAGVINVVTKRPSFDRQADVELTVGNYGALEGAASITGAMGEKVAGRLYVAARERDGFMDVETGNGPRTLNEDVDRQFETLRGQLLILPNDALEIRLSADYTDRSENCCAAPQITLAPSSLVPVTQVLQALQPGSFATTPDPFSRRAYSNRSTKQSVIDQGVSLEINWDNAGFGGSTLTSISAYRDWETVNGMDADFTTVDILYRDTDGSYANEFSQLSQELRLSGDTDRVSWLVGAFYAREDLDSRNPLTLGNQFFAYFNGLLGGGLTQAGLPPMAYTGGLGQMDYYDQQSTSWALFTNNSVRLTDALELTLGLRYTDESKELDSQYTNTNGGLGCSLLRSVPGLALHPQAASIFGIGCATLNDPLFNNLATSQTLDESEWSGTAKLAYRFNDDVMGYVSFARGYKAGGFNLDRERFGNPALAPNPANPLAVSVDPDTRFGMELVDSYELGFKTQWAGNSVLLNTALFYQEYTDFQLNTFTGVQFVVTSLPEVLSKGVDLDVLWYTPWEALTLQGGVTYAETTIEDFGSAVAFFRPERLNDRLSFAPKWSGSLSATYEQPLNATLLVRGNVGVKYTSDYNTGSNLDPRKMQDELTLVNARLGIGAQNDGWMVELWGQNLTNKDYYQVAFDATLQGSSATPVATSTVNAFLGAPRTYGVTARFRF